MKRSNIKYFFSWARCILVNILCWLTLFMGAIFKVLSKPLTEFLILPSLYVLLVRYRGADGGAPNLIEAAKLLVISSNGRIVIGTSIALFILVRVLYVNFGFTYYPFPFIYEYLNRSYLWLSSHNSPPRQNSCAVDKRMSPRKMKKMMEEYKKNPSYIDFDDPAYLASLRK